MAISRATIAACGPWDDALEQDGERLVLVNVNRRLSEWQDDYARYLKTERWREKRDLVLRRSDGQCEGCGMAGAAQVHHLTYDHCGDELLFELVALCHECHERAHAKRPDLKEIIAADDEWKDEEEEQWDEIREAGKATRKLREILPPERRCAELQARVVRLEQNCRADPRERNRLALDYAKMLLADAQDDLARHCPIEETGE